MRLDFRYRNLTNISQVPPKTRVKRVIDSKNQWSTMSPFDESVFEKPLEAEEKAKKTPQGFKAWFMSKATEIRCVFAGKR
jgi:hypothetical protein